MSKDNKSFHKFGQPKMDVEVVIVVWRHFTTLFVDAAAAACP